MEMPQLIVMQQALLRYYGNAATHCYTTGTATLLWKFNMVHRSCYQGKPNMSQYVYEIRYNNISLYADIIRD
jgi:hypothetical protein